jgi:hypothetical protein
MGTENKVNINMEEREQYFRVVKRLDELYTEIESPMKILEVESWVLPESPNSPNNNNNNYPKTVTV